MVSADAKKVESPSLPGDKRPLISDEASAATGGTGLGKVHLIHILLHFFIYILLHFFIYILVHFLSTSTSSSTSFTSLPTSL